MNPLGRMAAVAITVVVVIGGAFYALAPGIGPGGQPTAIPSATPTAIPSPTASPTPSRNTGAQRPTAGGWRRRLPGDLPHGL